MNLHTYPANQTMKSIETSSLLNFEIPKDKSLFINSTKESSPTDTFTNRLKEWARLTQFNSVYEDLPAMKTIETDRGVGMQVISVVLDDIDSSEHIEILSHVEGGK